MLQQHGHTVVAVDNVPAGLSIDPARVDAGLIDLSVGGRSGTEVVAHLAGRVPCIVLTQSDTAQDLAACLAAGARGYLLKSDAPQAVLLALDQATTGDLPLSAGVTRHLVAPLQPGAHPYTLAVDLASDRAELSELGRAPCVYRSEQTVSLLYTLAARFRLYGEGDRGWMDDVDLATAIWGRAHHEHGDNNLNVLIFRIRKRARQAGYERPFLDKRSGRTRVSVGQVRGV